MIRTNKLIRRALPPAAVLFCCAALAAPAGAQTFTVTSNATTGTNCTAHPTSCTIVEAINSANAISDSDSILFDDDYSISIDQPLPTVTAPLTIDAVGNAIEITGSNAYQSTAACTNGDPALGRTVPGVLVTKGIVVNNVCGNAFGTAASPAAPTIQVGPRRADNTVSINGSNSAGNVEIYRADSPATGREASSFYQAVSGAGGSFSYTPAATPSAGQKFTATVTNGSGTSNYAAIATTPQDLVSPSLIEAVATNNSTVRLDFTEAISGASSPASAFALGMSNNLRPITGVTVSGNSVFLASSLPWGTGEAGTVGITGNGRVFDNGGNELLGTPTATVYAGPGEINLPTVSAYRASPSRYCQKKTRSCKRGATYLYLTTNKASRVIFNFYIGLSKKRFVVRLIKHLEAGHNKVKIAGLINGKTLPASVMTVEVTAQDAARTWSTPVDTTIRVVKNKRDL